MSVFVTESKSKIIHIISSEQPQGCVLSPILFTICNNEMQIQDSTSYLYKYADEMALVGLMHEGESGRGERIV